VLGLLSEGTYALAVANFGRRKEAPAILLLAAAFALWHVLVLPIADGLFS
jgi:hypothetical protein